MLKVKNIPEAEWPAYRAKVDRVQTVMRMVGASVGRDPKLRWVPGDLWAYFPDLNMATYPFEHLLTHSEEEIIGVTDHEALHREITALDERFPLVRKYTEDPVKHFLWNGLEDPRVNSRGIHRLPGSERYLHALYDRYLPENLEAKPDALNQSPDLSAPQGDGGTGFDPKTMQFPHIEFVMAANYYWRHGKKPPKFLNKSAEAAFDKALPDMVEVFADYPKDAEPSDEAKLAHTLDALKRIDEKILPLYEPLVKESEKKLAKGMGKGKGKGQSKAGAGSGTTPKDAKPDGKKEGKAGADPKEQAGDGKIDPKALEQARRMIEEHARRAAGELGGKIKVNPKRSDVAKDPSKTHPPSGADPERQASGDAEPEPLTIGDIARTQRDQILAREGSPYQRAYEPVAHLSNPMVTHLENVFQKNARPRDVGWWRTGKRPDVKRYMKREGEGGVRDDYMLRRTQRTKRRYKVTLLVDESGSMEAFRREAINSVVLLVDSLARLQIDVEVIGFSETARVHKEFKDPLTPESKDKLVAELQAHLGNGNTHDADALKLAVDRISKEDAEGRFVFVVTDGQGNGPSSLASVFPQADASGIYVMGVGIGAGMGYVQTAYPHHAAVDRIEDLPAMLKDKLVEYITRTERGQASSPSAAAAPAAFLPGSMPLGGATAGTSSWTARLRHLPWFAAAVGAGSGAFVLTVMILATTLQPPLIPFLYGTLAVSLLLSMVFKRLPELGTLGFIALVTVPMSGFTGAAAAVVWAVLTAVAWAYLFPQLRERFAPLPRALADDLAAAAPDFSAAGDPAREAVLRSWADGLLGFRRARLKALAALTGRVPSSALITMLSLLARRDPDEAVRSAAINAIGAFAETRPEATAALRAVMGAQPTTRAAFDAARRYAEAGEKAQAGAAAETERLASLAAPAPVAPSSDLLGRARAFVSAIPDDAPLTDRMRRSAVEAAVAEVGRARSSADGTAALAERRLDEMLASDPARAGPAGSQALSPRSWFAGITKTDLAYLAALAAYAAVVFWLSALGMPWIALAYFLAVASSVLWGWRAFQLRDGTLKPLLLVMTAVLLPVQMVNMPAWLFPYVSTLFAAIATFTFLSIRRQRAQELALSLARRLSALRPDGMALAQQKALDALARAAKDRTASEKTALVARAREAAASAEQATVLGRMRRSVLAERASSLEKALADSDADAVAVAESRLREALDGGDPSSAGSSALPSGSRLLRFIARPWLLMALAIMGINAAIFGAVWVFIPLLKDLGGAMFIAFLFFVIGGKSRRSAIIALTLLPATMAVSAFRVPGLPWQVAYAAVTLLYIMAFLSRGDAAWAQRFGLLPSVLRRRMAGSVPRSSLDEQGKLWYDALGGWRRERDRTFEEMLRDRGRARQLLPALRVLLLEDMPRYNSDIIALLVSWGDDESVEILKRVLFRYDHTAQTQAAEALAKVRRGRAAAADMEKLALAAKAPAAPGQAHETELLARAEAALAALETHRDLNEKIRKAALEAHIAALKTALDSGDREGAAIGARRLRELLEGGGTAAGSNAMPWSPLAERALAFLRWDKLPFYWLQSSWILGLAVGLVAGSSVGVPLFAGLFLSGILFMLLQITVLKPTPKWNNGYGRFLPRRQIWWPILVGGALFLATAGGAPMWVFITGLASAGYGIVRHFSVKRWNLYRPLDGATRRAMSAVAARAAGSARPRPWLRYAKELLHPAYNRRFDAMRAVELSPIAGDPDLAELLGGLAAAETTPENFAAAVRLLGDIGGPAAAARLAPLASAPSSDPLLVATTLAAVRSRDAAERSAVGAVAEAARAPDPASKAADLLERGKSALAALRVETNPALPSRLRMRTIEERVAALREAAASGDEGLVALASRALSETLEPDSGAAGGSQALSSETRLRGWWAGAALAAVLAALLGAGLPIFLLWSSFHAAAVAAGAASALYAGGSLLRPLGRPSAHFQPAPRDAAFEPAEWKPVRETVEKLSAKLGLAPGQAPSTGLYSPPMEDLGLRNYNGYSHGRGLGPDSVVGVGEGWLSEPHEALEGLVAHEMGHLSRGDAVVAESWRRLHRLALWATALLAGSTPWLVSVLGTAGLAALPAAGLLLLASALLGLAYLRRSELRADSFMIQAAGIDAARAFLGAVAARSTRAPAGGLVGRVERLVSSHPTIAERLNNIDR